MIVSLYIGAERLDLFKDDNIIIKNAVSKIEDITKVFTETSNTFSVPATNNNNRIFKHYYNASINNGFDARKLVTGAIYLGGLHHKTGKFKLNKVILKSQKANSYSLDFFGLLTSLKDILKNDKLSDLDMSAYDYSLTASNVISNLSSNQPIKNIVNTILSPKRYIYNSDTSVDNTPTLKNLADNNSSSDSGLDWIDTSSSILNIRVIEAIESKYGLTFSRDFFGGQAFSNLYLLLNGGKPVNEFYEQVVITSSNDPTRSGNTLLYNVADASGYIVTINIETIGLGKDYDLIVKSGDETIIEVNNIKTGSNFLSGGFRVFSGYDFPSFNNLTFYIRSRDLISYKYTINTSPSGTSTTYESTSNTVVISGSYNVSEKMPDIKVIDYLKGFFQAYKLIVIPTSDSNLYITTLNDYYRSGKVRDITEFIDFKETPLSAGKLLKRIDYKFKESTTLLANQFRQNNDGVDYGSLELDIVDSNGNPIEGKDLKYELPFENMVYESLSDLSSADDINIVYGLLANDSLDPISIKPHIHYVNNVALISPIKVIAGVGQSVTSISSVNTPSHTLGYISPQFSTVFGEEFNEYNGVKITNTLYSNYHQDYIELIFNEKKRAYSFKAKNVSADLVKNLRLNDAIVIKGKNYRIDSYDTNIITKEITFNLINSLNQSLTPIKYLTADSESVKASSSLTTDTLTVAKDYNETPQILQ